MRFSDLCIDIRNKFCLKLILIIIFLQLPILSSLYAQKVSISGILYDSESNFLIEAATVQLSRLPDTTFVSGTISNKEGKFSFSGLYKGKYFLRASFLGYRPVEKTFEIKNEKDTLYLGRIDMFPSDVRLQEAVVVGKQSGVTINNDTIEYSPSAFRTVKSAVIEDLLKKLPGVEIDEDGHILVNGQEIKQIMLDNREFFGDDPAIAMKNFPVDMIEKLQVVEKKSDFEEMTGIDDGDRKYVINLKVKKEKRNGLFGTALAGIGTDEKYEANALLNRFKNNTRVTGIIGSNNTNNMGFSDMLKGLPSKIASQVSQASQRKKGIISTHTGGVNYTDWLWNKKMKVSGNLFVAHFNRNEYRNLHRENFQTNGFNTVNREQNNDSRSTQLKTGWRFDYQLNEKTRIIFRPDIVWGNAAQSEKAFYQTLRADTLLIDSAYIDNQSDEKNYFLNGVLTISRNMQKKGRNLTAEIAGILSHSNTDEDTRTDKKRFKDGNVANFVPSSTIQNSDRIVDKNEYRLKLSYSEPILPTLHFNLLYRFSRSTTVTDKDTRQWDTETEQYLPLASQTNRFENVFNNHRIRLGIRKFWAKANLRIGATLEPSRMQSYNYRADTLFYTISKNTFHVSPYVNLVCPFSKERILKVEVSGNTRQPSGAQMQPVRDESNPSYIREGNPDLKPIMATRFALTYNDYDKKRQQTITATAGMNIERNSIVNKVQYIDEGVRYSRPINLNGIWGGYFTFMYSKPLNAYFRLSSFTTGNYDRRITFLSDKDNAGEKNVSDNIRLRERLRLTYRNKWFELGIVENIRYNYAGYSLQTEMNVNAFDINTGAALEFYFPKEITLLVDYKYDVKTGYSDGFDTPQHLLDARLNITVFKNKQGTVSLRGHDILGQRKVVSRTVRSNYIEDILFSTQPRYVMLQFNYRFNSFSK